MLVRPGDSLGARHCGPETQGGHHGAIINRRQPSTNTSKTTANASQQRDGAGSPIGHECNMASRSHNMASDTRPLTEARRQDEHEAPSSQVMASTVDNKPLKSPRMVVGRGLVGSGQYLGTKYLPSFVLYVCRPPAPALQKAKCVKAFPADLDRLHCHGHGINPSRVPPPRN